MTIQIKATEQYFPVMLFITCMLYKAVLLLSMWMKSQSVTTEIKALDQYFSAQLIIFLSFPTFKFTKFTLYLLLCASFPSSTILSFHRYHWRYRADLSTPLASSFSSSVCHELPSFFPFLYFSFMFHLIHWHCGDLLCHNPREETFQLQGYMKVSALKQGQNVGMELGWFENQKTSSILHV